MILGVEYMQNKYYKQNISKEWLSVNGFRYNRSLSNEETHIYTYRFPAFKYKRMTVLECELSVCLEDGVVKINVYDYGTNDKYAAFYWNKIDKKLTDFEIKYILLR